MENYVLRIKMIFSKYSFAFFFSNKGRGFERNYFKLLNNNINDNSKENPDWSNFEKSRLFECRPSFTEQATLTY